MFVLTKKAMSFVYPTVCLWVGFLCCLVLVLGCEPRAMVQTEDPLLLSAVGETCSAKSDCQENLRCRASVCVPAKESARGVYYLDAARETLSKKKWTDGILLLDRSMSRYEQDGVSVPATAYCYYGNALRKKTNGRQDNEDAARMFHRCLLQSAAGSSGYLWALEGLRELEAEGFDPEHLAATDLVTKYLTKAPLMPRLESLLLRVTSQSKIRSKSYQNVVSFLQSDDMRTTLFPCWKKHWTETKQPNMGIVVSIRNLFRQGAYEEDDGYILRLGEVSAITGTSAQVAECASSVLTEKLRKYSSSGGSWKTKISLEIQ